MTATSEKRMGGGEAIQVVQPHNHKAVIGTLRNATQADAKDAIDAALAAAPAWRAMAFDDRAAIILRAAQRPVHQHGLAIRRHAQRGVFHVKERVL